MNNNIRNFHFADQEAPMLGIVTKSQLKSIVIIAFFPGMWFFYSFKISNSTTMLILSGIVFALSLLAGYILGVYKIDGRSVSKYLIDKRRDKKKIRGSRIKLTGTDINKLIASIKE